MLFVADPGRNVVCQFSHDLALVQQMAFALRDMLFCSSKCRCKRAQSMLPPLKSFHAPKFFDGLPIRRYGKTSSLKPGKQQPFGERHMQEINK
jgi:hypothetical protein